MKTLCFVLLTLISGPLFISGLDCNQAVIYTKEVLQHRENVSKIWNYLLDGLGKNEAFNKLAEISDTFGPRLSGEPVLEQVIDYVVAQMLEEGLENVATEYVTVPHWVRGKESAMMISPRQADLPMLGLGTSVGTPPEGIMAQVIVVTSFDDLEHKSSEVAGKIVVYNQAWNGYGSSVQYRYDGASRAARYGAVAVLIRSITNFSIDTPHTGQQNIRGLNPLARDTSRIYRPPIRSDLLVPKRADIEDSNYQKGVTKIPAACITVEDAEMLHRMYYRGANIIVRLHMEAQNFPDTISRNVVGEIVGYSKPEEVVIFGGHIDSWDVGTGSLDDGGGIIISLQAIYTLKRLGLRPKRTLRVVLWTGEEFGRRGGEEYFKAHKPEQNKISLIMESDFSTLIPYGLGFTGSGLAKFILQRIVDLLSSLGLNDVVDGGSASDIDDWITTGVPAANLLAKSDTYFYFHHSKGDTMTVLDANGLDRSTLLWGTVAYVVANLHEMLPRSGEYPQDCYYTKNIL